jgi:hypothetical protein
MCLLKEILIKNITDNGSVLVTNAIEKQDVCSINAMINGIRGGSTMAWGPIHRSPKLLNKN